MKTIRIIKKLVDDGAVVIETIDITEAHFRMERNLKRASEVLEQHRLEGRGLKEALAVANAEPLKSEARARSLAKEVEILEARVGTRSLLPHADGPRETIMNFEKTLKAMPEDP